MSALFPGGYFCLIFLMFQSAKHELLLKQPTEGAAVTALLACVIQSRFDFVSFVVLLKMTFETSLKSQ